MVLKIDEFFTKSKSRANVLQDENNHGWANNLQEIHFVFFKLHKGHSMSTHNPILPTISDFAEIWHVCRFG